MEIDAPEEQGFPHFALVEALRRLPLPFLLSPAIPLVNQAFRDAYNDQELWRDFLPADVVESATQPLPLVCRQVYFGTNLLRNPGLRAGGEGWNEEPPVGGPVQQSRWAYEGARPEGLLTEQEQGAAEDPPLPPPPLPRFRGDQGAASAGVVASSHSWGSLVQYVDLVEELEARGCSREAALDFLDSAPTSLELTLHCTARFDCPSRCRAALVLDDGGVDYPALWERQQQSAAIFSWLARQPILGLYCSGELRLEGVRWRRLAARVAGHSSGARRAAVILQGTDERFWAGYYGAKLAAPSLRFVTPQ